MTTAQIREYLKNKKISIVVPSIPLTPKVKLKKIIKQDLGILKNDIKLIENYIQKCQKIYDDRKKIDNIFFEKNNFFGTNKLIDSLHKNSFIDEPAIININELLKEYNCSNEKQLIAIIGQENIIYNKLIVSTNQLFILLNSILDINDNNIKETKSFFTNFELILDEIIEKYSNDKSIIKQIESKTNFENFFCDKFNDNSCFYQCIKKIKDLFFEMYEKIIDILIDLIANVLNYDDDKISNIKTSVHQKINFQENITLLRYYIEEVFKNMKEENGKLNQTINKVNNQLKEKKEEIDNLNQIINENNNQMKEQKNEIENLNQTINDLKNQLKEKKEEIENLNQTINENNNKLKEQKDEIEYLNQKITELNQQIKEEELQNEFLKIISEDNKNDDNNNKDNNNNNLINNNSNLQLILNQIKEENLAFLNKINEFRENKNQKLEFEIHQKNEEVNEVLAINKKYSLKIKILEKENNIFKNTENNDIKKLNEEFEKVKNELLDNIALEKKSDLENKLQLQQYINFLIDENTISKDLEKILQKKINELDKIQTINS